MRIFILIAFIFSAQIVKPQNPDKFNDCNIGNFTLDGGIIKAEFSEDLTQYFSAKFTPEQLRGVEGIITVQLLIDAKGRQCVKSISYSNCKKVSKLDLRNTINSMIGWKPAISGCPINVSIMIKFDFSIKPFSVSYLHDNFSTFKNFKSIGIVEIENKNQRYSKNKSVKKDRSIQFSKLNYTLGYVQGSFL